MAISAPSSLNMFTHLQIRNCGPSSSSLTPKRIAAFNSHDSMQSRGPQSAGRVGSLSMYGIHSSGGPTLKKASVEIQIPCAKKKKIRCNTVEYNKLDHYEILKYPLFTEAAIKLVADSNTLVFKVDKRSDKKNIRDAFEKMFKVKTQKINTLINYDGSKKAFITLKPPFDAAAIAQKYRLI